MSSEIAQETQVHSSDHHQGTTVSDLFNSDTIQLHTVPNSNNMEPSDEGNIERYKVKRVLIGERRAPIILQNLNGPCPLIAICNLMSLRGENIGMEDYIEKGFITNNNLVSVLAEYMLKKFNKKQQTEDAQYGILFQTALDHLPILKHGLDVNVQFTEGVSGFKTEKSELSVFKFFNMILMHGWLLDPEFDIETFKALKELSYNQAVEKIVLMEELMAAEEKLRKKLESDSSTTLNEREGSQISSHNDITESNNTEKPLTEYSTPEEMALKMSPQQKHQIINEGLLIKQFLENSSTQLTEYGLKMINQNLGERKLAVLFRNNHFSVICKIQDALLTLCTDETLLNETNIVWENLSSINGENQHYYLGDFTPFQMLETHSQNYEYHRNQQQQQPEFMSHQQQPPTLSHEDSDLQLALQLQQEEERAYQQQLAEQQQQQPQRSPRMQQQQLQPPMGSNDPTASPGMVSQSSSTASTSSNPYDREPSIPFGNVPTIREKKTSTNPNANTKYGSNNKYANQASQLRDLNTERRQREQQMRQEDPKAYAKKSKEAKRKSEDGCIIC
ncbi:hypothetical protein C9374_005606 [Naegleria lovaniensis]|uniref:MINDY deubiquitinase domain-containing protein n=1 Tax=Naegleria lovaniensis TaxID=51637 RepID=A0AA88GNN9_NAELO|nr:uncharacterized protein C9374_005606 [Naegleria lovaniensis]KAG2382404.1 hypothetical protein C9374_005606 [Naegleria lovaniensis]